MRSPLLRHPLIFATLATIFASWQPAPARAQTATVGSNLPSDPIQFKGQTGGAVDSKDCGFIPSNPSQVVNVTERINYMRLSVQANGGSPTLLIDGPGGRFCSLGGGSSNTPEMSGVWLPGRYSIYIGDKSSGNNYNYTLSISQQR